MEMNVNLHPTLGGPHPFSLQERFGGLDFHKPEVLKKTCEVCGEMYRNVMSQVGGEIRQSVFFFSEEPEIKDVGMMFTINGHAKNPETFGVLQDFSRVFSVVGYCFIACARTCIVKKEDPRFEKIKEIRVGTAKYNREDFSDLFKEAVVAISYFPVGFYGNMVEYTLDGPQVKWGEEYVLSEEKDGILESYFLSGLLPWENERPS